MKPARFAVALTTSLLLASSASAHSVSPLALAAAAKPPRTPLTHTPPPNLTRTTTTATRTTPATTTPTVTPSGGAATGRLPHTGADLVLEALLGASMLAAGLSLRRPWTGERR